MAFACVMVLNPALDISREVGMFTLLAALGIRVRHVPNLTEGALYIEDRRLLLLDDKLSDRQMADLVTQVVPVL